MKIKALLITMAIALIAVQNVDCSVKNSAKKEPSESRDSKTLFLVHEYIKQQLKDPESAKFRNEFVDGGTVVGEFDAKNSYGGYGGYENYLCKVEGDIVSGGFFIPTNNGDPLEKYMNALNRIEFNKNIDSLRMVIKAKKAK
jgi:hypothetical protein